MAIREEATPEPADMGSEPVDVRETDIEIYDDGKDLISFAEARVGLLKKIVQLSLRNTNEQDWVLMAARGGEPPRPYLQATGAEKIGRLFGVKVSNVVAKKYWLSEEHGEYMWEYLGTFSLRASPGDSMEVPGSRSSDDRFFTSQPKVDERDVKMAAYSNMMVNGITRLLGIRNMTIDDLEEAGLRLGRMAGVTYKETRKAAPAATGPASSAQAEDSIQRKLFRLVKSIVGPEDQAALQFLEGLTKFTDQDGREVAGARSFKTMSDSRAMVAYGKLNRMIQEGKVTPVGEEKEDGSPSDGRVEGSGGTDSRV